MAEILRKAPEGASFYQGGPQGYKLKFKISGKTKLKYDKKLKRIAMMTKRTKLL